MSNKIMRHAMAAAAGIDVDSPDDRIAKALLPHICHAHGCSTPVPPKMFMCRSHWSRLPKRTQAAIWAEYKPGQESRKDPTLRYLAVQQYAIGEVAFRPDDEDDAAICEAYMLRARAFRDEAVAAGEGDPLGWIDGPAGTAMKVLSVWCPWAQLIFFGKDVENRGRMLGWRGSVAIHASKGNHSASECADILTDLVEQGLISIETARQVADRVASDRGKVIGVVQFTGAKTSSPSPWWAKGQVAHELADQQLLETPIPLVGKQGLLNYTLPAGSTFLPAVPRPQLELKALLDVHHAIETWGANCGPAALAGALGLHLADVRDAVSLDGSFPGYMSITNMRHAMRRLGVVVERDWQKPPNRMLTRTRGEPILCCIAWGGPWSSVPKAAAKHRHFIVYRHGFVGMKGPGWVCDVNVEGGWILASEWKAKILPELLPERGDGTWMIQWAAQVWLPATETKLEPGFRRVPAFSDGSMDFYDDPADRGREGTGHA